VRRTALISASIIAIGVAVYLIRRAPVQGTSQTIDKNRPEQIATNVSVAAVETSGTSRRNAPLLGETLLRDYGRTNLPPANDLTLMSRLMENALLILKSAGNLPLSANEDWAALLRGQNAAQERFLPEGHPALDPHGRLVDRWGAPLFFHALGGGRYELRSAGPDRKMWTADDIHRNSDGSFRRGAELNSPSLLEDAQRHSPQ
jgi:hypothetical protein